MTPRFPGSQNLRPNLVALSSHQLSQTFIHFISFTHTQTLSKEQTRNNPPNPNSTLPIWSLWGAFFHSLILSLYPFSQPKFRSFFFLLFSLKISINRIPLPPIFFVFQWKIWELVKIFALIDCPAPRSIVFGEVQTIYVFFL